MSFDSRRPRNIYIGPRPRNGLDPTYSMEYTVLLHMDFVAYEEDDVYVNITKNRFNGRTGRYPRVVAHQWVNQLNQPINFEEVFN